MLCTSSYIESCDGSKHILRPSFRQTVSASRTESSRDSDEETSGEEEWRDDFDFSKPVSKKAQSKARAHDEGLPYFQVDQQDGHDTPQRDLEARMEALDASPCLALTPSRSPPRGEMRGLLDYSRVS